MTGRLGRKVILPAPIVWCALTRQESWQLGNRIGQESLQPCIAFRVCFSRSQVGHNTHQSPIRAAKDHRVQYRHCLCSIVRGHLPPAPFEHLIDQLAAEPLPKLRRLDLSWTRPGTQKPVLTLVRSDQLRTLTHLDLSSSFVSGDIAAAQRHNRRLIESYVFEGNDDAPNPVQPKVMMQTLGHAVGACRLPMGPAPAGTDDAARGVYELSLIHISQPTTPY